MKKAYYFKVQKLSIRASGIQAIQLIQREMAMELEEQEPLRIKRLPDGSAQLLLRSQRYSSPQGDEDKAKY
ncbi:hypothetical protein [Allocoleopsis franciscana]|uniref:hypothetical protein n=1 Tax=Allocoleopsis franciscana TaxID=2886352 RepID=UPI000310563D|nr:hypothetical protein [Allocoleopsis franciscana]